MTSPPYWGLRDYGHDDQLGLEPSPEQYVENMVNVFSEVRRVLKPTGTFYLNIDDTYAGSNTGHTGPADSMHKAAQEQRSAGKSLQSQLDLPEKCMVMVPERLAMALVQDGWILRNKICWTKPNPMPESVKDRYSTTWEYVYMFSKQQRYYFDLDAVREPHSESSKKRLSQNDGNPVFNPETEGRNVGGEETLDVENLCHANGKNPGDTWEITTKPFSDAHFAVYPPELCERPVKASCPPKVCAACGAPYERVVEAEERGDNSGKREYNIARLDNCSVPPQEDWQRKAEMKGREPTCDCASDETEKGIVLDPFAGAGTTCLVARQHNRRYIGIELNEEYAEMARQRIKREVGGKPLDQFIQT